jgi:hypothetical protein
MLQITIMGDMSGQGNSSIMQQGKNALAGLCRLKICLLKIATLSEESVTTADDVGQYGVCVS